MGNFYQLPSAKTSTKPRIQNSAAATPMPVSDEASKGPAAPAAAAQKDDEKSLERLAEESFMIHMKYGGEYIDENPITGRPGEFHLTTTGRKPPQIAKTDGPIRSINAPTTINTKIDDKKESKESKERTPKSATAPKPKRKKSKMVNSTSTPAASWVITGRSMALTWGKVMLLVSIQEFDTPIQFIIMPLSFVLTLN